MIFKKSNITYNFFKLNRRFTCSVFFIFIFEVFTASAFAETIRDSAREANSVLKKDGRVFLIHQPKEKDEFLDTKKPQNRILLPKDKLPAFERIKKLSLAKAKLGQIENFVDNKKLSQANPYRKNLILRVVNNSHN